MNEPFYVVVRIQLAASEDKLPQLAEQLTNRFSRPLSRLEIEPYDKFENGHEISFWVYFEDVTTNSAVKEVSQELGAGWIYTPSEADDGYSEGLWNDEFGEFVIPEAFFCVIYSFYPERNAKMLAEMEFEELP